ncbi:MAG: SufD family Fe-S cluster assembly protein [Chlamydiales bacterium]|nr:SufD family Fe-S cluster assembly protein [Chlamydiales bacterium]
MSGHVLLEPLQEDLFLRSLHEHYANASKEDALQHFRARSWDRFLDLGLPKKRKESYQYVPLRTLYVTEFLGREQILEELKVEDIESHILSECRHSCIVFVDGKFDKSLSNMSSIKHNIVWKALSDAFRTYGTFLNNHLGKSLKEETDAFALLNMALSSGSAFIYIPPKIKIEVPIQILHVVTNKSPLCFPRVQLFVGAFAEVSFVSKTVQEKDADVFLSGMYDFVVDEGAKVHYSTLDSSFKSWQFEFLRAQLKKNSLFQAVSHTRGAKTFRQDFYVSLLGENSECALYGLWDLKKNQESHTNVFIEHVAPFCKSLQLFKGVLSDTSKSSFEGKIYVHPEAQKTDAFQLNNHLFLSPYVIANSKPNLEIFADDVKASHGATFGQLNLDSLFYLKSRGISDAKARKLLIQGFTKEILDLLPFGRSL